MSFQAQYVEWGGEALDFPRGSRGGASLARAATNKSSGKSSGRPLTTSINTMHLPWSTTRARKYLQSHRAQDESGSARIFPAAETDCGRGTWIAGGAEKEDRPGRYAVYQHSRGRTLTSSRNYLQCVSCTSCSSLRAPILTKTRLIRD